MRTDVTLQIATRRWDAAFDTPTQAEVLTALEDGRLVVLPHLGFALAAEDLALLARAAPDATRKNITLDPASGSLLGTALDDADSARLAMLLDRFGVAAQSLLHRLVPRYAPVLERARTSFRPTEIAGRRYALRQDDRRLHVDAFPTRPMRGRRILRVFSKIAPDRRPRVWRVGEPFPEFAAHFLPRLRPGLPGQGWAMQLLGLTRGRRAPYDFLMLGLHDAAKLDDTYQLSAPTTELSFPAGTTWLCFTDAVLHAAIAGHYALEQTFHVPVTAMRRPEQAPLRVLERLAGRALA